MLIYYSIFMLGQITFQNLYFCVLFNYPEIYNTQLLTGYVKKKKQKTLLMHQVHGI